MSSKHRPPPRARKSSHNRRSVMKAFVVEKYGKSGLRAAQVPDPIIGPRDVLVRVSAASINPLDKMVRNGEFKLLLKYKTPFVLGHDVAGVVTRVGADVRDYKVGDEVDRTFPFDETLDALAFVEQGRAKGKIVVAMP